MHIIRIPEITSWIDTHTDGHVHRDKRHKNITPLALLKGDEGIKTICKQPFMPAIYKYKTGEHWIQCMTFVTETNAMCLQSSRGGQ